MATAKIFLRLYFQLHGSVKFKIIASKMAQLCYVCGNVKIILSIKSMASEIQI